MNHPAENKLTPSQLERKVTYADLILTILDDRYRIEEALLEKATTIHMSFNGYHCESYDTPEALDHYLQPFSAVTIDLSATRDESGASTIDRVAIYPEDGSALSLQRGKDFATIQHDETYDMLPANTLESALRQLLPYTVREQASVSQMLEFIHASSPESSYTIGYVEEADGQQNEISLSKTETLHDSIETLEVIKYTPHPSGAQIGTRMHLSESTSRRREHTNPDHTEQELVIEALHRHSATEELTVETLLNTDGRTIVVDTATRRHISDITNVLDMLK